MKLLLGSVESAVLWGNVASFFWFRGAPKGELHTVAGWGPRHPLALTSMTIAPMHSAVLRTVSIAARAAFKEDGALAQRVAVRVLQGAQEATRRPITTLLRRPCLSFQREALANVVDNDCLQLMLVFGASGSGSLEPALEGT